MLCHEKNLHPWNNVVYPACGFNAVQFRKTDIQQDQIWLEFPCPLNSFYAVTSFTHYL